MMVPLQLSLPMHNNSRDNGSNYSIIMENFDMKYKIHSGMGMGMGMGMGTMAGRYGDGDIF